MSRNNVVQQPVGLVLQALDFAAIANGQQRTVKADAIAEKNIFLLLNGIVASKLENNNRKKIHFTNNFLTNSN